MVSEVTQLTRVEAYAEAVLQATAATGMDGPFYTGPSVAVLEAKAAKARIAAKIDVAYVLPRAVLHPPIRSSGERPA